MSCVRYANTCSLCGESNVQSGDASVNGRIFDRHSRGGELMRDGFSRFSVAAFLVIMTVATGQAVGQDEEAVTPRSLTVDDYFRILTVDEPQISPDGEWVAYTVTTSDIEKDESTSRIWMVPSAGGDPVPMTAEARYASHAAVEPRRPVPGVPRRAAERRQGPGVDAVPRGRRRGAAHRHRPGRARLRVVARRHAHGARPAGPDAGRAGSEAGGGEKEEPAAVGHHPPPVQATTTSAISTAGGPTSTFSTWTSKTMTQITSGDYDDTEPAWSPDGERIAFTSNRSERPRQQLQHRHLGGGCGQHRQGSDTVADHYEPRTRRLTGLVAGRRMDRPYFRHRHRRQRLRDQPPGGGPCEGR